MKTVTDDYRYLRDHKLNKTVPQVIHPLDHLMECELMIDHILTWMHYKLMKFNKKYWSNPYQA